VVILDEEGVKYARAVGRKGLGGAGEMDWLAKDRSDELKAWGHPRGSGNRLILKSDRETSIVAMREALGRYHGGWLCLRRLQREKANLTELLRRLETL